LAGAIKKFRMEGKSTFNTSFSDKRMRGTYSLKRTLA
jgi:hypothetical protein